MKKILLFLTTLLPLAVQAQVANGYYRIQNNASQRYITIRDDQVGTVDYSSTNADLSNIQTWRGFDYVKSNPGSIIYIEQHGSQYNLITQGTSIYQISGNRRYLDFQDPYENGTYIFSITYNGTEFHLYDSNNDDDEGYVSNKKSESTHQYWKLLPVDTENNYIGLQPTVQIGEDWYGTVYASYPFKVASSNIKVYFIDAVKEGLCELKEITDEVKPASTPLLFKCSSNDPAQNKIMPVADATTHPDNNQMGGTYFARTSGHKVNVKYDATTMRVLGKNEAGELAFITGSADNLINKKYIPANTCWLNVPTGLTGDFKVVDSSTYTGIRSIEANTSSKASSATYTLSGVRVDNPTTPGIYIKDGKKIVIK